MKLAVVAFALAAATATFVLPAEADACAMRKVRLEPLEMVADAQMKKAALAEAKGDKRAAIRHYERAMNAEGNATVRADAALAAARLHGEMGNTQRAIARLTRGVALDGQHFEVRLALGRLLAEGDAAKAVAHLEAARGIDRMSAEVYPELAIAHARLGQRAEAQRYLTTAKGLGADPERVLAAEKILAGAAGGVAVL